MKKRLGAMVCVLVLLSMLSVFAVACNKDGFKINFYDGDSIVTSISTKGKEAITLPTDPVKAGYTFEGWFFEKEFINQLLSTTYENTKLKAEVNVYAKWTAFTYTINCDNDGAITTVKATYDKAFTCPAPTKTDYVFQGWYNGETQITDNLGASIVTLTGENGKTFTLTAKWALQTEGMAFSADGKTLTKYTGTAQYVVIPDGVTSIGGSAFFECKWVKSVIVPNTVTSIGQLAFYTCSGLTSITIGSGMISIGNNGFYNCSGLTSIAIPASVTSIGNHALLGCSGLNSITVEEDNTVYSGIGNCLIEKATKTLIFGCKSSVIPADGIVTTIGEWAFADNLSLENITIPYGVTQIAARAFLRSSISSITISNSVTSIGNGAFLFCDKLTSLAIPASVTSIEYSAFAYCGLNSVSVAEGNTKFYSEGNCIIEKETKTLIVGCNDSVIPTNENVKIIGMGAFGACDQITSITIPDNIVKIEDWAFAGCSKLTSFTIGSGVTSIGQLTFRDCIGLTSIIIPAKVTNISAYAFGNCANLATINCEAANPGEGKVPAGWDTNWKGNCDTTVVWSFVAA